LSTPLIEALHNELAILRSPMGADSLQKYSLHRTSHKTSFIRGYQFTRQTIGRVRVPRPGSLFETCNGSRYPSSVDSASLMTSLTIPGTLAADNPQTFGADGMSSFSSLLTGAESWVRLLRLRTQDVCRMSVRYPLNLKT